MSPSSTHVFLLATLVTILRGGGGHKEDLSNRRRSVHVHTTYFPSALGCSWLCLDRPSNFDRVRIHFTKKKWSPPSEAKDLSPPCFICLLVKEFRGSSHAPEMYCFWLHFFFFFFFYTPVLACMMEGRPNSSSSSLWMIGGPLGCDAVASMACEVFIWRHFRDPNCSVMHIRGATV